MAKNRISDLPEEDRPREKLVKWGPESLSNAELIAIFLRVGVPGKNAISIAQELLDTHISLRELGRSPHKLIAQQHGVGPAKAAQIVAAFELGLRCSREEMNNASIASPSDVYKLMRAVVNHQVHEKLFLLLANSKLKHLQTIELSHGTINETICHPRDVLHHVILHQAWGFVLVHNHPSGDPSPSTADKLITEKIKSASEILQVRCVDHIIIGAPTSKSSPYYSFREHGLLN